jgi:hypothetical protein
MIVKQYWPTNPLALKSDGRVASALPSLHFPSAFGFLLFTRTATPPSAAHRSPKPPKTPGGSSAKHPDEIFLTGRVFRLSLSLSFPQVGGDLGRGRSD